MLNHQPNSVISFPLFGEISFGLVSAHLKPTQMWCLSIFLLFFVPEIMAAICPWLSWQIYPIYQLCPLKCRWILTDVLRRGNRVAFVKMMSSHVKLDWNIIDSSCESDLFFYWKPPWCRFLFFPPQARYQLTLFTRIRDLYWNTTSLHAHTRAWCKGQIATPMSPPITSRM